MAQNTGKIFEENFKKSIPENVLLYRLPNPAQSFGGSNNLRFSLKPPFDYLLWDSSQHILYALELKTVKGKSISFERSKEDSGVIHFHQIKGLNEWNKYDGIKSGFIIEFRDYEKTIFLHIEEFNKLINLIDKKSFNLEDLDFYEVQYTVIKQTKVRTRYKYDIQEFLTR